MITIKTLPISAHTWYGSIPATTTGGRPGGAHAYNFLTKIEVHKAKQPDNQLKLVLKLYYKQIALELYTPIATV